jgi:hypothetical protein
MLEQGSDPSTPEFTTTTPVAFLQMKKKIFFESETH